jgi:hypothetical protein
LFEGNQVPKPSPISPEFYQNDHTLAIFLTLSFLLSTAIIGLIYLHRKWRPFPFLQTSLSKANFEAEISVKNSVATKEDLSHIAAINERQQSFKLPSLPKKRMMYCTFNEEINGWMPILDDSV